MELIKVTNPVQPHIALIEFNRPKELNALSVPLMSELRHALQKLDVDNEVRVIV
ncbi:MAG: enoyl-CoA hydratase-related protein, partial [Bacteroidota bacterium]|nr:enoyl-CoA hydratase-related protein [Bacteroidota bacterium]